MPIVLTPNQARIVYQRYWGDKSLTLEKLATEYGVDKSTVSRVVNRETWSDVADTPLVMVSPTSDCVKCVHRHWCIAAGNIVGKCDKYQP